MTLREALRERLRARLSLPAGIVLALLCAAPTVGDVGSCGEEAVPLDARSFWTERATLTCRRCRDCGHTTAACATACSVDTPLPATFPLGCRPLVHDGEVCLRALEALGCGDFGRAVVEPPVVPTECDFCPSSPETSDP